MKKKCVFAVAVLMSVLLSAGTAWSQIKSDTRQWDRYQKKVEKAANLEQKIMILEEFIQKFPDSAYKKDAVRMRDEAAWKIAVSANTLESYKKFESAYPESHLAPQAEEKIAEWEYDQAKKSDTPEAFEKFLASHPGSKQAEPAKACLKLLQDFERAKSSHTVEGYQEFMAKYPESEKAGEAKKSIKSIERGKKSLADLIAFFRENGWDGTYAPNQYPHPFTEVGEFKGDGFLFLVAKFSPESNPQFGQMYDKSSANFGIDRSSRGFKSVTYANMGSFYLILMITKESLSEKLKKLSSALDIW